MRVSALIPKKYNWADVQVFNFSTRNIDPDQRWNHGITFMPHPNANPRLRINRVTSMQFLFNFSAVDHIDAFIHLNVYIIKAPYLGEAGHHGFEASIEELRRNPEFVVSVQPVHLSCQKHTSVTISLGELLFNPGEVLRVVFSCYNKVPKRLENIGTEENPIWTPVIDLFNLPVSFHVFANAVPN